MYNSSFLLFVEFDKKNVAKLNHFGQDVSDMVTLKSSRFWPFWHACVALDKICPYDTLGNNGGERKRDVFTETR